MSVAFDRSPALRAAIEDVGRELERVMDGGQETYIVATKRLTELAEDLRRLRALDAVP